MKRSFSPRFVLSCYPTSHGFAFVLFEGPEAPFDWGVREIRSRQKNELTRDAIRALIDRYHPIALVIEATDENSQRRSRIQRLYRMLAHVAECAQIEVFCYSRKEVRASFASVGARTKYEIAKAIVLQIPAFSHRLPPMRKIWMSEDPRQSLFDAAALGLTYYARKEAAPNAE